MTDSTILMERELDNGTTLYLCAMLFNVRLVQGPTGAMSFDRGWCYDARLIGPASHDAMNWDGESEHPPGPWMKCVHTGEFREDMKGTPEAVLARMEATQ